MFFLPSVRLRSQLHTLDSQLRYKGALVSSYSQAVDQEDRDNRYLLLDLASSTPSQFRFRSKVTDEIQHLYIV